MIYDEFVKGISKLDSSNKFIKSKVTNNPYNKFYDFYDPRGVEFEFNGGVVFMIPYDKIDKVTADYHILNANYVFATCNGDQYFVKNGKVYTCCHGMKKPDLEFLAESFEDFLKNVLKGDN